jgi:hypothetical protein
MTCELLMLTVIYLSGALVVCAMGLRGWGLAAFGFPVGSFTLVSVGFIQVCANLPTNPIWTLSATFLLSLALWFWSPTRFSPNRREWLSLLAGLFVLGAIVFITHKLSLVKFSEDSFRYILISWVLESNNYDLANINLATKRLLSTPILNSIGLICGDVYTRSIIPLLSASLLAVLWWYFWNGTKDASLKFYRCAVAIAMVLLLATNNRYVFSSFYLNGHIFFALCYLVIAASGWILATVRGVPQLALLGIVVVAIPALTVTRAESTLAIGLALAPLLLSETVHWRRRALLLGVYGASTIVWSAYVVTVYWDAGRPVPVSAIGPLALGVVALVAIPVLGWPSLTAHRRQLLLGAEVFLWLVLVGLTLHDPKTLTESLAATYQNVIMGAGSWGSSVVWMGIMVALSLLLCRSKSLIYLRFPVTAFIPLYFLLAYFREMPYRVGNGDSLNRMLIHIFPLAILYVAASVASDGWRFPEWISRRGPFEKKANKVAVSEEIWHCQSKSA